MENHPQRHRVDGPAIICPEAAAAKEDSVLAEIVNELVSIHEDVAAHLKYIIAEYPSLNITTKFEDAINPIDGRTYCRIKRAEK